MKYCDDCKYLNDKRIILNKKENQLLTTIVNIVMPVLILSYLSSENYLGPTLGFVVAFAFPLCYGIYDFFDRKKFNFFSALGVINVLLTGGIGILKIDNHWLAVKEAAIPAIIGLLAIGSLKTKYPLIRIILYNDIVFDTKGINEELEKRENTKNFNSLLSKSTIILAGSFFFSSFLNYALAKFIVTSPPGTMEYNQELGRMTMLSYPVILLPSLIFMGFSIWYLFNGIKKLTNLNFENILSRSLKSLKE